MNRIEQMKRRLRAYGNLPEQRTSLIALAGELRKMRLEMIEKGFTLWRDLPWINKKNRS